MPNDTRMKYLKSQLVSSRLATSFHVSMGRCRRLLTTFSWCNKSLSCWVKSVLNCRSKIVKLSEWRKESLIMFLHKLDNWKFDKSSEFYFILFIQLSVKKYVLPILSNIHITFYISSLGSSLSLLTAKNFRGQCIKFDKANFNILLFMSVEL